MEKTFKTFDHVMVRNEKDENWRPALFVRYAEDSTETKVFPFVAMDLGRGITDEFKFLISYDDYLQNHTGEINEKLDHLKYGDIIGLKLASHDKMDIVIFKEVTDDGKILVIRDWDRNNSGEYRDRGSYWADRGEVMEIEKDLPAADIEAFNEYMKKNGEVWNPETKQVVLYRWKPNVGDTYWHIELNCKGFAAIIAKYIGQSDEQTRVELGNAYQTERQALDKIEELKKVKF